MCTWLHSDLTFRGPPHGHIHSMQVVLYHTVIAKNKQAGTCVGSKITTLLSSTPHLPCHRFKIGYTPACQVGVGRQLCIWTRLEHTKSERGTQKKKKIALMFLTKMKHKGPPRGRPKYLQSWESRYGKSSRKRVKTKHNDVKMLPQDSHTLPTALGSNKVWGLRPREANLTRMQTPYLRVVPHFPRSENIGYIQEVQWPKHWTSNKNYSYKDTQQFVGVFPLSSFFRCAKSFLFVMLPQDKRLEGHPHGDLSSEYNECQFYNSMITNPPPFGTLKTGRLLFGPKIEPLAK